MTTPKIRPDMHIQVEAAGERINHYETVRLRKDGRPLEVSLTISPVKDSDGRIIGASKIAHDISQRKQAEFRLNQSEEKLNYCRSIRVVSRDWDINFLRGPKMSMVERRGPNKSFTPTTRMP